MTDQPFPRPRPGRNLAVASLCLGLVAIVPALIPISAWLSIMLSIPGLVLGLVAAIRGRSVFAVLFGVFTVLLCAFVLAFGCWSLGQFFTALDHLKAAVPAPTHSTSSTN